MSRDPFEPVTPVGSDSGRLELVGHLEPGWPCRVCRTTRLARTSGGALVCLACDLPTPREDTTR